MSVTNALPVREDLVESLSYLISRNIAKSDYTKKRDVARERFLVANQCSDKTAQKQV